ncbi:MAG: hypothetical protein IID49_09710, partial [Proteobacteria bacterium]|nr:hypothetical protein [Pseudomonadota bacterium]
MGETHRCVRVFVQGVVGWHPPYGALKAKGDRAMEEWVAATVLPNIELQVPIGGGCVALVPRDDARIKALCCSHPNLKKFLSKFTDAFNEKIRPAVLIVHKDAPQSVFTVDALASFRDAIAVSTVAYNRALELRHPHGLRINFSNSFWFYPWMLDKQNEDLTCRTFAMLGTHEVSAFKGQSSPEIPQKTLSSSDIDQPLLDALISRWQRRYTGRRISWSDRALFRSLNMANQAAMLPAGSDTTFYDVGRLIALWVSAFEILAHPGIGKSDIFAVYDLLEKVEWKKKPCAARRYKAYSPKRNAQHRRTLACWLYGEIFDARNQSLHGNAVSPNRLIIKKT